MPCAFVLACSPPNSSPASLGGSLDTSFAAATPVQLWAENSLWIQAQQPVEEPLSSDGCLSRSNGCG